MRAAVLLFVTTTVLAGCAGATSASPSQSRGSSPAPSPTGAPTPTTTISPGYVAWFDPTPYPAPAGATPLQLAVVPPAQPQPSGQGYVCPLALSTPVVVGRAGDAITLTNTLGDVNPLLWPRGFSAWLVDGKAEVLAPDGSVVGREGDTLSNLGGGGNTFCSVGDQTYLPSP